MQQFLSIEDAGARSKLGGMTTTLVGPAGPFGHLTPWEYIDQGQQLRPKKPDFYIDLSRPELGFTSLLHSFAAFTDAPRRGVTLLPIVLRLSLQLRRHLASGFLP